MRRRLTRFPDSFNQLESAVVTVLRRVCYLFFLCVCGGVGVYLEGIDVFRGCYWSLIVGGTSSSKGEGVKRLPGGKIKKKVRIFFFIFLPQYIFTVRRCRFIG